MSENITITLPAIDETLIQAIDAETTLTLESETQAVTALREKYSPFAKYNGFISTGYFALKHIEKHAHLVEDGQKVRAFRVNDLFDNEKYGGDQNRGKYYGSRLYLTADGRWIELNRKGTFSYWQGESDIWTCGDVIWDDDDIAMEDDRGGNVTVLTDAEVAAQYDIANVIEELAKQLATLNEKLPERLTDIRKRAALAAQLLTALK